MNDNAHDRLINGTGLNNTYIGYRLQRCTWDLLKEKFQYSFGENWESELESHHCELFNTMEMLIIMNNSKKIEFEYYSCEFFGQGGILVKERTLLEEEQKQFILTKDYKPLKRYEVTGFTDFEPSIFKNVSKSFHYDFVMEVKGEYSHILYNSEKDVFYHVKEHEVSEITRDQVDIPIAECFFWDKFDKLLETYIVSSLEGNTPSCLRIIAECYDEYSNDVAKPDCFGLEKLLEFDRLDKWSEYCFEDSVQVVTSNVLRRF